MGLSFYSLNELDTAEILLLKSLEIRSELENLGNLGSSTNALALVYIEQGRKEEAMLYFRKAYDLWKRASDYEGLSIVTENLASEYFRNNDLDSVIFYSLEAVKYGEKGNHLPFLFEPYMTLAETFEKKGNFKKLYFIKRKQCH